MTRTKLDFIAPVGKGPVKGGKLNEVPYNFGKGGTKGKGKMHKRLGFQPERGEQRTFWRILQLVLANRTQRSPVLV